MLTNLDTLSNEYHKDLHFALSLSNKLDEEIINEESTINVNDHIYKNYTYAVGVTSPDLLDFAVKTLIKDFLGSLHVNNKVSIRQPIIIQHNTENKTYSISFRAATYTAH